MALLWPEGGDSNDKPNQQAEDNFDGGAEESAEACAEAQANGIFHPASAGNFKDKSYNSCTGAGAEKRAEQGYGNQKSAKDGTGESTDEGSE